VRKWEAEMKAHQERMMATIKASLEEMKSIGEHQVVPKEEATVETIRALKDWSGDQHLAEEMDPGLWWVPEEVGRWPRMTCHVVPVWPIMVTVTKD
jgi:hypothetical protein